MQLVLPEQTARLTFDAPEQATEEAFLAFCEANPGLRIERTAKGEIVIVPPAGGESDYRSLEIGAELRSWAKQEGSGTAFGSSVEFLLPDGSALSPDAAWVSNEKLAALTKAQRRQFLRLVPDFVCEVMSPSDRLSAAQVKMQAWIENGVRLGWLLDADAKTIYVYRQTRSVEVLQGLKFITADEPLQGFTVHLQAIWAGL